MITHFLRCDRVLFLEKCEKRRGMRWVKRSNGHFQRIFGCWYWNVSSLGACWALFSTEFNDEMEVRSFLSSRFINYDFLVANRVKIWPSNGIFNSLRCKPTAKYLERGVWGSQDEAKPPIEPFYSLDMDWTKSNQHISNSISTYSNSKSEQSSTPARKEDPNNQIARDFSRKEIRPKIPTPQIIQILTRQQWNEVPL